MLKINNLNIFYGAIHAVRNVSLEIAKGEIVTLIGANGAGKSSVIRSIIGLVKAHGEIIFNPDDNNAVEITNMPVENRVKAGIALSPEGRRILPQLTVEENLKLGAYIRDDVSGILNDIDYVYSLFPRLKERRKQKGSTLSGGEQQMLALGRALMSKPKFRTCADFG